MTPDELIHAQLDVLMEGIAELVAERDALREQVRVLREALDDIATETYDSWTNGAKAGKIARAALAATKEQIE